MKKLRMITMCLLAMMATSLSVKAQEVTITLMPGWNWISLPMMDTLDFETALGSFTPVTGDMIKSQWGNASYRADGHWRGQISQFYPGYGYKYYSNRMMPVMVTFQAQQPAPQGDVHEYVDLGLPSGLLWATCNVGANAPEEYGDYFAWGETQPKETYNWSTYQHCNGSDNTLTKYCYNSDYGYNGFVDNLTVLLQEDDGATIDWGVEWRTPTKEEWQELLDNTTNIQTTQNGIYGRLFTASNGNTLFLPAAGLVWYGAIFYDGSWGYYWSSSLDMEDPRRACELVFNWENSNYDNIGRSGGLPIRAVRSMSQNNTPTGAINGKFTINADGNQVYFSQGNLQYQASTNTWRFAENQWDYVGEDNSNISQTYDGWIDLFGWGTSGYNHGATCYQPWSTSQTNSDYYAYGNWNYNLFDQNGQADWGYNPICNAGNQGNSGWRTLTIAELDYLFNIRVTHSGIRYAKAQVNSVNGLILLPDNWNTNIYSLSNTNNPWTEFRSNTITSLQWMILEQAGAIFLPAAGGRNGVYVSEVGSYGDYWAASFSQYNNGVCYVYFSNDDFADIYDCQRYHGMSVRLVRDAE